jgi:hypothetical protein
VWKRWRIVIKCGSLLKNRDTLCTLKAYQHLLPIIIYKHWRYQGGLLMANYTDMYTRSKKWIKMRMEIIIGFYGKGNEIISWCLLHVGSCFVLSNNSCYMCCCCQSTLHHICMNRINNDNVRQGSKMVFGNDNIHSFPCMVREKAGNFFLYVSSILQCNSCNGISKHIMGCNVFILAWAT